MWSAQQHHDLQREGMAVYYTPTSMPKEGGRTLNQCHKEVNGQDSAALVIVDKDGNTVWSWNYMDHTQRSTVSELPERGLLARPEQVV